MPFLRVLLATEPAGQEPRYLLAEHRSQAGDLSRSPTLKQRRGCILLGEVRRPRLPKGSDPPGSGRAGSLPFTSPPERCPPLEWYPTSRGVKPALSSTCDWALRQLWPWSASSASSATTTSPFPPRPPELLTVPQTLHAFAPAHPSSCLTTCHTSRSLCGRSACHLRSLPGLPATPRQS